MNYLILSLWICFSPLVSVSQNQNIGVQKGWLVYFGIEEVCFPEDQNQPGLSFFNKKERLNGYNINTTGYKSCVYKEISKSYPIKMYYGNDSIFVLPVTFKVEFIEEKAGSVRNRQDSVTIYEIEFKGELYKLGYVLNKEVQLTKIKPSLIRDWLKSVITKCPFYEGPQATMPPGHKAS